MKICAAVFLCLFVAIECQWNQPVFKSRYEKTTQPEAFNPRCGSFVSFRILGGTNIMPNEFPWLATLEYRKRTNEPIQFGCAGSLITKRYVLTAAHCLVGKIDWNGGPLAWVRLGVHDKDSDANCQHKGDTNCALIMGYENVKVHGSYNARSSNHEHDIGLIRLKQDVPFSNRIRPICLTQSKGNMKGRSFTVAGWGATLNETDSSVMQKVVVPFVHPTECNDRYRSKKITLGKNQMCAGGKPGEDSCKGDSGGPLMLTTGKVWILEGITSIGHSCGKDFPSIYTRVDGYIDWINNIITDNEYNDLYYQYNSL